MNTLVIGATGTVGRFVIKELLSRSVEVTALTRDPAGKSLPKDVRIAQGDLGDPATAQKAMKGIEAVFLLNALGPTETHDALLAVNAACKNGVERFVYLSIHGLRDSQSNIPHFGSKLPVESALRHSTMEWTLIRPNNFMQNDLWFKQAICEYGVYPQPLGSVGLSRVDVRDVAEAAAIALTQDGHGGSIYELVGPDVLTGPQMARIWSEAMGKDIVYGGDDLDNWEAASREFLPASLLFDLRLMYEWFQAYGLKATKEELHTLHALLGRAPRSMRGFAQEIAREWNDAASASPA